MSQYSIRPGTADDIEAIIELLPRLADFDIPENRNANDLWAGDRDMMIAWAEGRRDDVDVFVAIDDSQTVIGLSAVSRRKEMLSGEPSSHLEVLTLDKSAEGQGLGMALIAAAEAHAKSTGAKSMTLHVFSSNTRARKLYEKFGFEGEVVRYNKTFRD